MIIFSFTLAIFAISVQGCFSSSDSASDHHERALKLKTQNRPAVLDDKFVQVRIELIRTPLTWINYF